MFIKYATALSYHCNREIFELENGAISQFIYDLQSVFSSGKNVTEQIHNDFRNYIINVFRNETTFIKAPLRYEIGKGFVHPDITRDSEGKLINYDEVNNISIEIINSTITPTPVETSITIVLFSIFSNLSLYLDSLAFCCKLEIFLEKVISCSCFLS